MRGLDYLLAEGGIPYSTWVIATLPIESFAQLTGAIIRRYPEASLPAAAQLGSLGLKAYRAGVALSSGEVDRLEPADIPEDPRLRPGEWEYTVRIETRLADSEEPTYREWIRRTGGSLSLQELSDLLTGDQGDLPESITGGARGDYIMHVRSVTRGA